MPTRTAPQLGLVCMTCSDEVRFRTITRSRLHAQPARSRPAVLRALYRDNLSRLRAGFRFCQRSEIRLFRLSSDLFPFADTPLGARILEELTGDLQQAAEDARGLRLVMHPDQFVVLSSERPEAVRNAEAALAMHGLVLDLLGQPRSPWAAINIHGGKRGRGRVLGRRLRELPDPVRRRITLENDEYAYGTDEILAVCHEAGVPMVLDAHHHLVHEGLDTYEHPSIVRGLGAARQTWPDPDWQLVHISNGRTAPGDRAHSDLIRVMPSCFRQAPWIEVEAKAKERAIAALRALGW